MVGNTTDAYPVNVGAAAYGKIPSSPKQVIKLKYRAKPEASPAIKMKPRQTGNSGCWCHFDSNVFCQETGGCVNCTSGMRARSEL